MKYNLRIDDNYLKADWKDGEILQHTDVNELDIVVKTAINANYEDIQKILDGTYVVGSASGIDGATLSKYAIETLSNSDDKIPSSLQVKQYVDEAKQKAIDSIPTKVSAFENDAGYLIKSVDNLENYYKKNEVYTIEQTKEEIKTNNYLDNYFLKNETYNRTDVKTLIKESDNLINYYLKSQTYTKDEVNNIVSNIEKVTIQKVDTLPTTGESNVIYFVPKAHTEFDNIYDEYIWVDNDWENIGDTELDNLDLDLVKNGHTATLTITKRNGTQVSVDVYDGVTPNVEVGTVTQLAEGENPTVTRTGTDEDPLFNFGIPIGPTGERGPQGVSPKATVSQNGDVTTISIEDVNGTTSATIDLSAWNSDIIARLQTLTTLDETSIVNKLASLAGDSNE